MGLPLFYHYFFGYVDPIIASYGVYLNFLAPQEAVSGLAPRSVYDQNQVFLFHQAGGLAAAVAIVSALLPHVASADTSVWKVVQLGLLVSDFAGLSGIYHALERQGRLTSWTGDDAGIAGTYLLLTAIRAAFVLGVGVPAEHKRSKTN